MDSYHYTPITPSTPLLSPSTKPTSRPVQIDPNASGIIIRVALATETLIKIIVAFLLTFFPHLIFGSAVTDSTNLTPATISLRWIGEILLAITIQHVFAIQNTRAALESRLLKPEWFGRYTDALEIGEIAEDEI